MRLSLVLSVTASITSTFARARSNSSTTFVVSPTGKVSQHRNAALASTSSSSLNTSASATAERMTVDPEYPGTAVKRMLAVRERVKQLSSDDLNGPWENVRRKLLWAGGLKDLPTARPGQGYTGHSFNDYNHVDLTAMRDGESDNENDGQVQGIAIGNQLGSGIRVASLPELGPGGSWSTCAMGCNKDPPQDVAHLQFRSRIAFKLVWVPPMFEQFVLVDDAGKLLAKGNPVGGPSLRERQMNYQLVQGSKYAKEADAVGQVASAE